MSVAPPIFKRGDLVLFKDQTIQSGLFAVFSDPFGPNQDGQFLYRLIDIDDEDFILNAVPENLLEFFVTPILNPHFFKLQAFVTAKEGPFKDVPLQIFAFAGHSVTGDPLYECADIFAIEGITVILGETNLSRIPPPIVDIFQDLDTSLRKALAPLIVRLGNLGLASSDIKTFQAFAAGANNTLVELVREDIKQTGKDIEEIPRNVSQFLAPHFAGNLVLVEAVPELTKELVKPFITAQADRLAGLIGGIGLPDVSGLLALVPSWAAFLLNPLEEILASGGELTISGDINVAS